MKTKLYLAIAYALGCGTGLLISNLYFKKKYNEEANKRADDEIEDMRQWYEEWNKTCSAEQERPIIEPVSPEVEEKESEDIVQSLKVTSASMKRVNYCGKYGVDPAEEEHPMDDNDSNIYAGSQEFIELVDDYEIGSEVGLGSEELIYYMGDKTLVVSDTEEVIFDPKRIAGNFLEEFEKDPSRTSLRVKSRGTIYEILRCNAKYEEGD